MNLDATPETIRNVAEALKLAAILDDRVAQADRHRIAAWSEQVERHHLLRKDLLDGLQAFYDSPSERAIQIGDMIHHARICKRTRLEKEEDDEREARRAELDVKAANEIRTLTADAIMGRTKETPRLTAAREALENCRGKRECQPAIQEFHAAKREASGRHPAKARS